MTGSKPRLEIPKKLSVCSQAAFCLSVRQNQFEKYEYHRDGLEHTGVKVCRETAISYLRINSFGFYISVEVSVSHNVYVDRLPKDFNFWYQKLNKKHNIIPNFQEYNVN
ncbi:hypothetical protein PHYBLDRAFT_59998 [Phycomyces blakesleeanus NRRL 1555(-)]|uniref:Uncharacterized protein n=1 Tax=Phycomyces blakesleeanus (strain ATCC 8743b / DSM 1359 / FGSC 10004 / NBRC 33097 / NRRL 1555) TaxID=763407 RepID=A0A162XTM0_PHYB8|nr:hypothetical protein PHYBLDRAFT_59998 [Phycomyces blakesleeanus NRRL 1555(-)]OAD76465.1 hypothetical protein PHYBLDRAFT_59998 [Phycomyces blakesleeanus NRRL 1555(-)]|eukprot:XP_018294505.1 hypothetical protein PHYBLDRAFT_59998 [Phycomyces blakesleeanus NRRL 1555(-)]